MGIDGYGLSDMVPLKMVVDVGGEMAFIILHKQTKFNSNYYYFINYNLGLPILI